VAARRRPGDDRSPAELARDEAKAREEVDRRNQLIELRDILQDERVRDLLWRIMAGTGMFTDQFNANAAIMGRNTGIASVGKLILNEILEANPEAWIIMQQRAWAAQIDEIARQEQERDQRMAEGGDNS